MLLFARRLPMRWVGGCESAALIGIETLAECGDVSGAGYAVGMAERDTPEDSQEMVTLFSSSNHDGEQEALAIHSLLEASGIPSVVVGPSVLPSLEFRVEVERQNLEQAERTVAEAKAAGPAAAEEAEAASEDSV